jgi:hypothetical protein
MIERFGTYFVTGLWVVFVSPISEEQKTNARKLSLVSCQRPIAGPFAVTYNNKGGREKRESCGRNG